MGGMQNLSRIVNMFRNRDLQELMHYMMDTNPQFAQFYEQHKGKPIEEVAKQYGIDPNEITKMIR